MIYKSVRNHKIVTLLFLVSCLIFNPFKALFSQNVLVLDTAPRVLTLNQYAYFFHDSSNTLTIDDVASGRYDSDFELDHSLFYNFKNAEATHWMRIQIAPNKTSETNWFFVIWTPTTRIFELYNKDSTGHYKRVSHGGMDFPFYQRAISTNRITFDLPINAKDTSILYLKQIASQSNLEIESSKNYYQQLYYEQISFGLIYGILIALLLYNLFLFLGLRDKSYLYYVLYLGSYLLLISSGMQHSFQFIWPENPWLGLHANSLFMTLAFFFALLFCKQFLLIHIYAPRLKIFFTICQTVWILNFLYIFFVSYTWSINYVNMQIVFPALFSLSLILYSGIVSYQKGFKPAKYYLIAWLPLVLLILIKLLTVLFSLPEFVIRFRNGYVSFDTTILAPVVESLLLSMALGFRINLLRQQVADEKRNIEKIELEKETEKRALIEKQKNELEQRVELRTHELEQRSLELENEKLKSDKLLLNILPFEVAEELKERGKINAKTYSMVTIMFTDFKDFTSVSERISAELLVAEIDYCFSAFDNIIQKYNIEKIKTVGDAYIAAGGMPALSYTHALDTVNAAIEIRDFMSSRKNEKIAKGEIPFEIRIGINTGPVVAGIVGTKKFAYDIWGDTVNLAARMEQSCDPGKINISGSTYELIKEKFNCKHRGKIQAKNKGDIDMYFVEFKEV